MAENNKKSFFDFFKTKKGKYIAIGAGAVVGIAAITGIAVAASQNTNSATSAEIKKANNSLELELKKVQKFIEDEILTKEVNNTLKNSKTNTNQLRAQTTDLATKFEEMVNLVKEKETTLTKEGEEKTKYENALKFLEKVATVVEKFKFKSDANATNDPILTSNVERSKYKEWVKTDLTLKNELESAGLITRRILIPTWMKFQNEIIKSINELETAKTNQAEVNNLRAILLKEGVTAYQIEAFRTFANEELKKANKTELPAFDKTEQLAVNFQKLADLKQDLLTTKEIKVAQEIVEKI